MSDDLVFDHWYRGEARSGASCQYMYARTHPLQVVEICGRQAMEHADTKGASFLKANPHLYTERGDSTCGWKVSDGITSCGYPEMAHHIGITTGQPVDYAHNYTEEDREYLRGKASGALVRAADVAQYERPAMPDAARRGIVVTLIDAPVDPLGTLAVIGGIYTGKVARSKGEVTDEARRAMLDDMLATVLSGPLEAIQFTFLVEGVSRSITHQMVRNRFAFFAQESLRFAVASDWAQEVPLPPSLRSLPDDAPAVGVWRKALNQSEDSYNALIGAGMPAEEARGVLAHDITTRLYWTVSLRTLLAEAGKRTCTQAQFPWRELFGGVAKVLRERGKWGWNEAGPGYLHAQGGNTDGWQYTAFADLIRPVCYQQGKCGFMAKFDRGCTIRARVDLNEKAGRPSSEWGQRQHYSDNGMEIEAIDPREWAADPAAARVVE